jgi:hypothetical protein
VSFGRENPYSSRRDQKLNIISVDKIKLCEDIIMEDDNTPSPQLQAR